MIVNPVMLACPPLPLVYDTEVVAGQPGGDRQHLGARLRPGAFPFATIGACLAPLMPPGGGMPPICQGCPQNLPPRLPDGGTLQRTYADHEGAIHL